MEIFVIFEVRKYMFILIVDKREKELSESSEKGTGVLTSRYGNLSLIFSRKLDVKFTALFQQTVKRIVHVCVVKIARKLPAKLLKRKQYQVCTLKCIDIVNG